MGRVGLFQTAIQPAWAGMLILFPSVDPTVDVRDSAGRLDPVSVVHSVT